MAIPDGEVPLASIPDEEVPLAAIPATGDISAWWYALTLICAGGLLGLGVNGKKRKKSQKG